MLPSLLLPPHTLFSASPQIFSFPSHHIIMHLAIRLSPAGWHKPGKMRESVFFLLLPFVHRSLPSFCLSRLCISNRLPAYMRYSRRAAEIKTELMLCFNGSCLISIHQHRSRHQQGRKQISSTEGAILTDERTQNIIPRSVPAFLIL